MQLDLYIIGISIFLVGLIIGALLNYQKPKQVIQNTREEKPRHIMLDLGEEPHAPLHTQQEDIINHEGVGIVYRPTVEEIAKMNEPEKIREAKEAMAETLRQEKEPEI